MIRRAGARATALLAILWAGGFMWFAAVTTSRTGPVALPHADGIVVLTGGADRVETALRLLSDHRADLLLISGVGGRAEFPELARRAGVDATLSELVTLGRSAASTRGNALETAEWAGAHRLHSLLVVTAVYHMPRAIAELGRAMPQVRLTPVPVAPRTPEGPSLRLLATEYVKYLGAVVGLSGWVPHSGEA